MVAFFASDRFFVGAVSFFVGLVVFTVNGTLIVDSFFASDKFFVSVVAFFFVGVVDLFVGVVGLFAGRVSFIDVLLSGGFSTLFGVLIIKFGSDSLEVAGDFSFSVFLDIGETLVGDLLLASFSLFKSLCLGCINFGVGGVLGGGGVFGSSFIIFCCRLFTFVVGFC